MSTSSAALKEARVIQEAMGDYGVTCIIQLRQGASGSGWLNPVRNWRGVMSHHIVSARTHGTTPFYNLVRNGRAGLPGPLSNGYGGWDKKYRIITMGWANHPGAGGPITLAGNRIPLNNGRPYFWGTEYEGGMNASDWERDDYHGWMATCNAALLDALGLPTSAHLEHLTWAPGRKVDRLRYTTASGRNRIAAVRGKKSERDWFDMATEADLRRIVREEIDNRVGRATWAYRNSNHDTRDAWGILRSGERNAVGAANFVPSDVVAELLATPIQGMSVAWWLRSGLVLDSDHRQHPADPGSLADLIMRIAEEVTGEEVVPYDGSQRRDGEESVDPPKPEPKDPSLPKGDGSLIMAQPSATLEHLLKRAKEIGAHKRFIEEMAPASYEAAIKYSLDPTAVIAQSAHETGWGKFGGVLDETYFNVAGIKKREGGGNFDPEAHQRFDSWQHGAEAHASHLRAYCSVPIEPPLEDLSPRSVWVWPKNHKFTRLRQLGGHYAPSKTYGERVEAVAGRLLEGS